MKLLSKFLILFGMGLFLSSFFIPAVHITSDIELNGFYAFLLNLSMLFYVDSGMEYFEFVFMILTNVWVVFLFIRYWRKNESRILTFFVAALAITSGLYWLFRIEDTSTLLIGFWAWLVGVLFISGASILKGKNQEE